MDTFEKQFEDLDVQTSVMETTMGNTTATNVPQDAVEGLMKQAADEAGLELNMDLPGATSNTIGTTVGATRTSSVRGWQGSDRERRKRGGM
jgi:charged multivesicular body protein 1